MTKRTFPTVIRLNIVVEDNKPNEFEIANVTVNSAPVDPDYNGQSDTLWPIFNGGSGGALLQIRYRPPVDLSDDDDPPTPQWISVDANDLIIDDFVRDHRPGTNYTGHVRSISDIGGGRDRMAQVGSSRPDRTGLHQPEVRGATMSKPVKQAENEISDVHYDQERKVLIIEVPYDINGDYIDSASGKTEMVLNNQKATVILDTGLNIEEGFFIAASVYRYKQLPKVRH